VGSPPSEGRCVIGYASRLADEKAPDLFLDAAELLHGVTEMHFVMAGSGPLSKHIANRVRRGRALGERVRLVGLVEDTAALMSTFDVLVLPSVLEGRPNIVLEAMAMGIPVVATRVGGVPELVQQNVTGFLVEAGDAEGLAEHVRYLAEHPDERARMGREARNAAVSMHNLRRTQEAYAGFFRDLLEAPAKRSTEQPPAEGDEPETG
jgi:glycosyltransferase involved in cell wall biosynthesis